MDNSPSLFEVLKFAESQNTDDAQMALLYSDYLSLSSSKARKPYTVQLELSPVCNFNCGFCFIRKTNEEVEQSGQHIMRFDEWKYYIDECIKLGVNQVTLSGGECTLYPDFAKLYEYVYNKGLGINVITNASLISDDIYELFEKYPPAKISITLYGMSAETYERTCSNGDAFEKVINNIERLNERGFSISINYTAGKENFCDMDAILAYGREKGIPVYPTDGLIVSRNCDKETLKKEAVDYKSYKRKELKHFSIVRGVPYEDLERAFYNSFAKPLYHKKVGLFCGAGRSGMFFNWHGFMVPCVNFDVYKVDPREIGFENAWKKIVEWADNVPLLEECEGCIFADKCRRCPAFHYGDMGEFGKVSPRFCFKELYPEEAAAAMAKYEEMKANGEIE